jgi:hypothetical protein
MWCEEFYFGNHVLLAIVVVTLLEVKSYTL